jgi:hypothetical protein
VAPSSFTATVDAEVPVDAPAEPPTVATGERPIGLGLGPPLAAIPDTATATPPAASATATPSSLPLVGARGFTEVPVQRSATPVVRPGAKATVQRSVRAAVQRSAEQPTATTADVAQADVVAPERPVVDPAQPEAAEPEAAEPESQAEPGPTEAKDDPETVPETGPEEPSSDLARPAELVGPPPLASAPLPLATALPTTIQRSIEHSTPSAPVPRLVVRRAPDLAPRGRERVVPVQRVRADAAATLRPEAVTATAPPRVQRGFLATVLQRRTAAPVKVSSVVTPASLVASASLVTPSSSPPAAATAAPVGTEQVQRGFFAAAFRRSPASVAERTPEPEVTAAPPPGAPVATHAAVPSLRTPEQRTPVDPPVALQQQAVDVPLGTAVTTAPPTAPPTARPAVRPTPTPTLVQREVRDVVPMPLPPVPAPTTVAVQAMPTDDGPPTVPPAPPPAPDPPGPAPVVARAGEPAATTGTPAGPAGAAGAAGGAPGGATDVEALAQRLFNPMLRRMKAELLLDRERRGMRTDAW